jgi:hypothetical protein
VGICPFRVTAPLSKAWSGLWSGLEPHQTEPLPKNWTAGGLPRPVAHTKQGEAQNSPKAYVFVVSLKIIQPESCQGEDYGKAWFNIDVRHLECRNKFLCMHMQQQAK